MIVGVGALVEKTFEGGRAGEPLQVVRSLKDNLGMQLVALNAVEEFRGVL